MSHFQKIIFGKLSHYFMFGNIFWKKLGQSLATNLVVAKGYNITQYVFIGSEFWQIHRWFTSFSYIIHACKISKKLKINSYVINKLFKLQIFLV